MKCPDCGEKLNKVYTESEYGQAIELNQCPACGGIWFDEWELYPLNQEKAKKIDRLDFEKLHHRSAVKKESKLCPKCGKKLRIFKDPNIPKDFEIETCPKCFGLWLNQGETVKYKRYQEAKKKKKEKKPKTKEERKIEENIEKLLEFHKSSDTLGNIGRFLSTPIDRYTMCPLPSYKSKENISVEKIAQITTAILNLLLRLFTRSVFR